MKKQEFLDKITEIGTCEDDVTRRSLLTALSEEATRVFDTNDTLTADNEKYKKENEDVRQANMQLFLQVSGKSKPEEKQKQDSEEKKLSYENLFDEKGEIK